MMMMMMMMMTGHPKASNREPSGIAETGFLMTGCPSCRLTSSVTALKW